MALEIYDGDWMFQRQAIPQKKDHNDAGPIGLGTRGPTYRYATRCERDADRDLVYGDEVRITEFEETQTLPLPYREPLTVRAKVFETSDKSLLGHSIAYTAYPYSRNDRGRASFKIPSHHKKPDLWAKIEDEISKGDVPLTRIIDRLPHDPFRNDGETLRCYILEPEQDLAGLFSNRRASQSELQKALRWIQDDDPERDPNEPSPDFISDLILFGIVDNYDEAFRWLIGNELSMQLFEWAEKGTLFEPIRHYRKKWMTDEAKNAAQSFLELAAHNVLCGTAFPNAYRGYYYSNTRAKRRSDAASSVESGTSQRGSARGDDEVRRYKQTLAVHLEHRFLDLMYNYNHSLVSRKSYSPVVTSSDQSHYAEKTRAIGLSLEEAIHVLKSNGFLDLAKRTSNRNRLKKMIESVRQSDPATLDPDKIFPILTLTVALHQQNAADPEHIDFVKRLGQTAKDLDEDLQAQIEEAIELLES
jgi:hypothetical protein